MSSNVLLFIICLRTGAGATIEIVYRYSQGSVQLSIVACPRRLLCIVIFLITLVLLPLSLAWAYSWPIDAVSRLIDKFGIQDMDSHVVVFAQRTEIPIQALNALLVGLDALSFQPFIELINS